jgi:predicted metalloprotease with PDZ domain
MQRLRYGLDLRDRRQHLVRVELLLPAQVAAGGRLVVATWTPGSYVERDYVHHLQSLRAVDASGAELRLTPDGRTWWRLPDDLHGDVTVQLEWYANELTVRTNHVDDHHALIVPPATFPWIEGLEQEPVEVHVTGTGDAPVWSLLPPGDVDGVFLADDLHHLIDSAFEVGDHPTIAFDVDGVPHRWVHASHAGSIDLDRVATDVAAISEQAQAVFDGPLPVDAYTFLCVGGDATAGGGGLEHRDGSVLMLPSLTDLDEDGVARTQSLIAHEYLHLWNVKRLVPAELVDLAHDRPTHTTSLWVAEGWTAYYDELLPTRAGLWSPRRYLDRLRDDITWVERTPGARRQSLAMSSWHAWTGLYIRDENSLNAGTSYYTHGAVVAACLDLLLRRADPDGDGLDEVFRLLWQRFGHDEPQGHPRTGYRHDDVVDALGTVAGHDLTGFVDEHVTGTAPPPIGDLLGVVGLELVESVPKPPTADLGVRLSEDDRGPRIDAVLRDGPAWLAGVTGGDRLVAIDGTVVRRGEVPRVLRLHEPGDTVVLTVERGPRLLGLPVVLDTPRLDLQLQPVADPEERQRTAFARWTGHPLTEAGRRG